jgi:hypothetical protein
MIHVDVVFVSEHNDECFGQKLREIFTELAYHVVRCFIWISFFTEQAAAASTAVSEDPTINTTSPVNKRDIVERDSTCAKQKAGKGPVVKPDTPEAFLALDALSVSIELSADLQLCIAELQDRL